MIKDFKDWIFENGQEVDPDQITRVNSFDPEWLASLKDHPVDLVRSKVAYHHNTPLDVRLELARDPEWSVRSWAAFGADKLPEETIRELAEDPHPEVRKEIALSQFAPIDIIEKLADDSDYGVRYRVSKNPVCPTIVLIKLSEDPEPIVAKSAKEKLDARGGGLGELFDDF